MTMMLFTQSQKHRSVELLRDIWRSSSPDHLLRTGSPRSGCPGQCQISFWMSPRLETPQPLWETCCSVWRSSW